MAAPGNPNDFVSPAVELILFLIAAVTSAWATMKSKSTGAWRNTAEAWQSEMEVMKERLERVEKQAHDAEERARSAESNLKLLIDAGIGTSIGPKILQRLDDIYAVARDSRQDLVNEMDRQHDENC